MTASIPDDLKSKPSSCKLVWLVLTNAERPLTRPEIEDRTGLSRWTVRTTTRSLARDGYIELEPNPNDLRTKRCKIPHK